MIELEYAKDIANGKYVHLDRVVSISKALISVTAILEEVTKQLTIQKLVAENAALRRIALGYHILTVPEREAPTEPEIDAAIAEIKAQGVDELIADRKSEWIVSYCEDAAEFAASLRAGRKG